MALLTTVTARVSTTVDWLDLNAGIYRLHPDSFADQAIGYRRDDVSNPFVRGTWTVNALEENVMETLSVWVRGESQAEALAGVEALKTAFRQLNYTLQVTFDDQKYTYTCYVADVSVSTTRELRHNAYAQFTATIPRHPGYTLETI